MNAISTASSGANEVTIGTQTFTVSKGTGGDDRLDFKLKGTGNFAGAEVTVTGSTGSLIQAGTEYDDATPTLAPSGNAAPVSVGVVADRLINFTVTAGAIAGAVDGAQITFTVSGQTFTVTLDEIGRASCRERV